MQRIRELADEALSAVAGGTMNDSGDWSLGDYHGAALENYVWNLDACNDYFPAGSNREECKMQAGRLYNDEW